MGLGWQDAGHLGSLCAAEVISHYGAFNEACESSGDTPSSALRRFIDSYIRRADGDAFKDGLRAMGRMARRRWIPLSAATAALLVGGYFTGQALKPTPQDGPIVTASTDDFPPIDYALFAAYDKNANGVLDNMWIKEVLKLELMITGLLLRLCGHRR